MPNQNVTKRHGRQPVGKGWMTNVLLALSGLAAALWMVHKRVAKIEHVLVEHDLVAETKVD